MRPTFSNVCAAAGVALLAFSLAACTNPIEKFVDSQKGVEIETGGDGATVTTEDGTVSVGTGAELPSDFPSDVPTPDGKLTVAVAAVGGWSLKYDGVTSDAMAELEAQLTAAGYEKVSRMATGDAIQAGYRNGQWFITIMWTNTSGTNDLVYGVTPTS